MQPFLILSPRVDVVAERVVDAVHGVAEGAVERGLVGAPLAEGGDARAGVGPHHVLHGQEELVDRLLVRDGRLHCGVTEEEELQ